MRGKPPIQCDSVSGGMDNAKQYCKYWDNLILLISEYHIRERIKQKERDYYEQQNTH